MSKYDGCELCMNYPCGKTKLAKKYCPKRLFALHNRADRTAVLVKDVDGHGEVVDWFPTFAEAQKAAEDLDSEYSIYVSDRRIKNTPQD